MNCKIVGALLFLQAEILLQADAVSRWQCRQKKASLFNGWCYYFYNSGRRIWSLEKANDVCKKRGYGEVVRPMHDFEEALNFISGMAIDKMGKKVGEKSGYINAKNKYKGCSGWIDSEGNAVSTFLSGHWEKKKMICENMCAVLTPAKEVVSSVMCDTGTKSVTYAFCMERAKQNPKWNKLIHDVTIAFLPTFQMVPETMSRIEAELACQYFDMTLATASNELQVQAIVDYTSQFGQDFRMTYKKRDRLGYTVGVAEGFNGVPRDLWGPDEPNHLTGDYTVRRVLDRNHEQPAMALCQTKEHANHLSS